MGMDINLGSMLRALLKEGQPIDTKAVELRIGQIVRGVLMELLDNNEALMSINGTPVRAKLDADLAVGQSTLLQVQPESKSGMLTLKPIADPSGAVTPDETLKEGVKPFGLPEQKWSFELVGGLKRDGYPIGRDTAQWFKQAADAMPRGSDAESWMKAAGVAFRRGLQPTETTIASLRQALFGPPLHEQLQAMEKLLQTAGADQDSGRSPETTSVLNRVARLLADGGRLLQGGVQLVGEQELPEHLPAAASNSGTRLTNVPGRSGEASALTGIAADSSDQTSASGVREGATDRLTGGNTTPREGTPSQGTSTRLAAGENVKMQQPPIPGGPLASSQAAISMNGEDGAEKSSSAQTAAGATASATKEAAWVGRFLQWLGAGHEHGAVQAMREGAASLQSGQGAAAELQATGDSLKSSLLAMAARDDLPPALREAAQGLAQQITGQQLLLTAERQPSAMMSQMTMFIPLKGRDGDSTATVHIETRRGRKGEWDANNCRMLFDLSMQNLGHTIVDVQVVDKVVSLRLLNDSPWVADLVEAAREEAAAGLQGAGYRLLSLTTSPYPSMKTDGAEAGDAAGLSATEHPIGGTYAAKPYKGVDYRA